MRVHLIPYHGADSLSTAYQCKQSYYYASIDKCTRGALDVAAVNMVAWLGVGGKKAVTNHCCSKEKTASSSVHKMFRY